jgi:exonuclease III
VKLLSWNIRQGGGTRLARIVEELAAHDADLIALNEYRTAPGRELYAELSDRGWPHLETTSPAENENGIAVFSRVPMRRMRPCCAAPEHHVRWLDIDLPEHGFGLAVLHIPAAGSSKSHPLNISKVRYWETLLQVAESRLHKPFLLVGDWNTGAHRVDEKGKTFVCAELLKLSTLGWTDMWRYHNPGTTEWTWYSTLKVGARGNGFRLDHCFATPSLRPRLTSCRYSHAERDAGISDHSIVITELDERPPQTLR